MKNLSRPAKIWLLLLAFWLPGCLFPGPTWGMAAEGQVLGVLAFRPVPQTMERWQPLADYLNRRIPGLNLELRALNYGDLEAQLQAGEIDFVLTNPAHYVMLKERNQLSSPLASLINLEQGQPVRGFGGVILVSTQRDDLRRLADLRGKKVATVTKRSLGGYQVQAYELLRHGLDPSRDIQLLETEMPHDAALEAMLSGRADAAMVRSGLLEALVAEGRLDPNSVRVLNPVAVPGAPLALSTPLYPEWPFAALAHADEQAALKVASALFALPHGGEISSRCEIYGFTVPADYKPVDDLLRALRLPPFDHSPHFTFADVWARWGLLMVIMAISGGLIMLLSLALSLAWGRERRERERFQLLLSTLGEGVYGVDLAGRCTFINAAALRLLGAEESEVLGRDQHQIFHHHYPDGRPYPHEECPIHQTLQDGRSRQLEEWFFRKDGTGFPVELVVSPMQVGKKLVGAVVVFQDITGRKAVEAELQRSNADLEHFAYAVSHDLRQPLRMVAGFLQLLRKSLPDERLAEEQRDFFAQAIAGADRLDQMIQGLLEYSRLGRREAAFTLLAGRETLEEARRFLAPELEASGAELTISGDWPQLVADRDQLVRLWQNLLGNAVKYVAEGVKPVIEIESRVSGNTWRVSVRDNGIGVEPEQAHRLFKVFSRLQPRGRYEGTGLGLALCRRIVEHHRGELGVESAGPGQGSVFWFSLPLRCC